MHQQRDVNRHLSDFHLMGWTPPASGPSMLPQRPGRGVHHMQMLEIDLGKQSFHIYGITCEGEVISRKLSSATLVDAVTRLQPQSVAIEACPSSHHSGRAFKPTLYAFRLLPPR